MNVFHFCPTFSPSIYYQRNFLPQPSELRTMSIVSLVIMSTTEVATAVRRWEQHITITVHERENPRVKPWKHVINSFCFCKYGGSMWLLGLRRYCRVCVSAASGLDLKKLSTILFKSARDYSKSSVSPQKRVFRK